VCALAGARSSSSHQGMQIEAPGPRPRRRGPAIALVAVASLLAFGTVLAVWVDRQLLDTGNWTAASSQMLDEPAIRDQTAAYLTDQLYENVDVAAEIRAALPAAGLLRDRVEVRAREALIRPEVQELWENANRAAHETMLKVLDGGGPNVATEGGVVVLDLKALLADLERRSGLGGKIGQALPASAAEITVLRSDQLDLAQKGANVLAGLPILLAALSLALFGAALLVAPRYRRRAVRGYGAGLMVAGAGALACAAWAGDVIVDSLARTAATEPAVRAVWDIYDTLLVQAATAAIGYGVVLVGAAWLVGPTRWAVATRRALAPYLRQPMIAYGALAVIVLVVVAWWAPTPATRNPVTAAVLVGLLVLGFEGLRRQTVRELPAVIVPDVPANGAEPRAPEPRDEADAQLQTPLTR
jgi:hypothetical protein